jgi:hypothetical protein
LRVGEGAYLPEVGGGPSSYNGEKTASMVFLFFDSPDPDEFDLKKFLKGLLRSDPVRPEPKRGVTGFTTGSISTPILEGYGLNSDVYFESDAMIPEGPSEGAQVTGFALASSDVAVRFLSVSDDVSIPTGATIAYGGQSFGLHAGDSFDFGSTGITNFVVAGLKPELQAPEPFVFALQFIEEGATELTFDYDLYHPPGDFNENGFTDGRNFLAWQRNPSLGDLADWQSHYGTPGLSAASGLAAGTVSEPNSFVMCLAGLVLAGMNR